MNRTEQLEKIADTDIRIAYENRCYGDIIVAVDEIMSEAIKKAELKRRWKRR